MSKTKVVAKKATVTKSSETESYATMKIEDNIPLPKRGIRDPAFLLKASDLLKQIKVKQSFVVPKNKVYAVKKINRTDFAHLALRTALIKPQNQFARVWRIK